MESPHIPTPNSAAIRCALHHPLATVLAIALCAQAHGLDLTITTPPQDCVAGNALHFIATPAQTNLTRVSISFQDDVTGAWLPEEALSPGPGGIWMIDRQIRHSGSRRAIAYGYRNGVYQGASSVLSFSVAEAPSQPSQLRLVADDTGVSVWPPNPNITIGERVVVSAGEIRFGEKEAVQSGPIHLDPWSIPAGIPEVDLTWYDASGHIRGSAVWALESGPVDADLRRGEDMALSVGKGAVLLALGDAIRDSFPDAPSFKAAIPGGSPEQDPTSFMGKLFSLIESADGNNTGAESFARTPRLPGAVRSLPVPPSIVRGLQLLQNGESLFFPLVERMSSENHLELARKFGDSLRQALLDAGASFSYENGVEVMKAPGVSLETLRAAMANRLRVIYTWEGLYVRGSRYLLGHADSLALATKAARSSIMSYGSALPELMAKVFPYYTMEVAERNFLSKAARILTGTRSLRYYVGRRMAGILAQVANLRYYVHEAQIVGSNLLRNGETLISPAVLARTKSIIQRGGKYLPGIFLGVTFIEMATTYDRAYASSTDHLLEDSSMIWAKGHLVLVSHGISLDALSPESRRAFDARVISCLSDQEAQAYSTSTAVALVTTNAVSTVSGVAAAGTVEFVSAGTLTVIAPATGFAVAAGVSVAISTPVQDASNYLTKKVLERTLDWRIQHCATAAYNDSILPILSVPPPSTGGNNSSSSPGVTFVTPPRRFATLSDINSGAQVTIDAIPQSSN